MSMGAVGRQATRISAHGEDSLAAAQTYGRSGDGPAGWGDDGLFGVFTAAYNEARQTAAAALGALSAEIGATGDGLHAVRKNTADTESANTAGAGNLRQTWV
jgi:hypothetical protein